MSDRRRKRETSNSFADDTVKDFNAVDPIQVRRQSDWSEHDSGMRQESWMAKVSLAMSSRIFSGGKLSGSRSTQVMPIGSNGDNSKTSLERTPLSSSSHHELRHVASVNTLGNSSPVVTPGSGLRVTCDAAPDDSDDSLSEVEDEDKCRWSSCRSTPRQSRRQHSSTIVQKVRPGYDNDEAEEEEERITRSTGTRVTEIPTGIMRSCSDSDPEVNAQDAAPILKGFFSKTVSVNKEHRQQQREQQREAVYRESKQRQDRFREQIARERAANEEASRQRKVEQLRRLNQQRRLELLRGAACARKDLLKRVQEDTAMYQAERKKWENDFEEEMQVLSAAFRKARTTDENRPMTAAGLALPEALSQLERDASNFEKRVKTAQPALASMNPRQQATERPSTREAISARDRPLFESCEVLVLEDSSDVFDLFGNDDQASELFLIKSSNVLVERKKQPNHDFDQLLSEREQLLQRLAAIDRIIQTQQQ
ncbi:hypothetical protein V7S43_006785 [Phytophthora oleae]|uniref:Pinin/SDK/MemA protein domain-containing protein n=1 Tax=Phytophthora oleae TaxID=2107226 RepID=A0ABD3FLX7_9STRA